MIETGSYMLRQNNVLSEVKPLPTEHINLKSTLIWFPKTNCIYHLKNAETGLDTTITFAGQRIEKLEFIDISSLSFREHSSELISSDVKGIIFISNQTLPFDPTPKGSPPLLYSLIEAKPFIFTSLSITLDEEFKYKCEPLPPRFYVPDNESIQNTVVKAMGDAKPALFMLVSILFLLTLKSCLHRVF